jgi:type II secretory pathway component GspD/PulD (secretin)
MRASRFGDPRDASPKGTKIFRLAHAEAPTLKKTLVDLLLGTFEFNMVADERTNTLLVHGTKEGIKAIEDLLQVLDAPADDSKATENRQIPGPNE